MSKLFATLKQLERRQRTSDPQQKQIAALPHSSKGKKTVNGKKILAVTLFFVLSGAAALVLLPKLLTSTNVTGDVSVAVPTSNRQSPIEPSINIRPESPSARPANLGNNTDPGPDHGTNRVSAPDRQTGQASPQMVTAASVNSLSQPDNGTDTHGSEPVAFGWKKKKHDWGEKTLASQLVASQQPLKATESSPPDTGPAVSGLSMDRRQKQLLQAAEDCLKRDDFGEAARLYRLVWKKTGNPLVANNLAASLMMMDRNLEAVNILQEALQQHPGDTDLEYNLEMARARVKDIEE